MWVPHLPPSPCVAVTGDLCCCCSISVRPQCAHYDLAPLAHTVPASAVAGHQGGCPHCVLIVPHSLLHSVCVCVCEGSRHWAVGPRQSASHPALSSLTPPLICTIRRPLCICKQQATRALAMLWRKVHSLATPTLQHGSCCKNQHIHKGIGSKANQLTGRPVTTC